jgi:acyl-CoA reductase-like NAD-dependent aldehyde dehydrogenase
MAIATINPATGETVRVFAPYDAATVQRGIAEALAAYEALHRPRCCTRGLGVCADGTARDSESIGC